MKPPELRDPENSKEETVDLTSPGRVQFWAEKLLVNEAALRLLVELHGPKVSDLQLAIRKATIIRVKRSSSPG